MIDAKNTVVKKHEQGGKTAQVIQSRNILDILAFQEACFSGDCQRPLSVAENTSLCIVVLAIAGAILKVYLLFSRKVIIP